MQIILLDLWLLVSFLLQPPMGKVYVFVYIEMITMNLDYNWLSKICSKFCVFPESFKLLALMLTLMVYYDVYLFNKYLIVRAI